jgi:hypothetical protein
MCPAPFLENGPRGAAAERGSSKHRPSVTFGCASAPARLPSATRVAKTNRSPTVASGRLDGLPRPRYTLLRHALPEDCPVRQCAPRIENCPRTLSNPARPTVAPLLVHPGARESRAPLSTRIREPAGVPSLRMCRSPSELVRAHSQGGHPRESRHGEARHSHQEGRRAARRWPGLHEDEGRLTPQQGGEPERRRDKRRT